MKLERAECQRITAWWYQYGQTRGKIVHWRNLYSDSVNAEYVLMGRGLEYWNYYVYVKLRSKLGHELKDTNMMDVQVPMHKGCTRIRIIPGVIEIGCDYGHFGDEQWGHVQPGSEPPEQILREFQETLQWVEQYEGRGGEQ